MALRAFEMLLSGSRPGRYRHPASRNTFSFGGFFPTCTSLCIAGEVLSEPLSHSRASGNPGHCGKPHRDFYGRAVAHLTAMIAGLAPRARCFLVATRKHPKKRSPVARRAKDARFPALLGRRGGWPTAHPCAAANARSLPRPAKSAGLTLAALRCSASSYGAK